MQTFPKGLNSSETHDFLQSFLKKDLKKDVEIKNKKRKWRKFIAWLPRLYELLTGIRLVKKH